MLNLRQRDRWKLVGILTGIGIAFAAGYVGLRVLGSIMQFSWWELEHAVRTGAFVGFCLATFMVFYVYDQPGAAIRRMSFVAGWVVIDTASTAIIAFAILTQRLVFAAIHSKMALFTNYLTTEFPIDLLVSFIVFVVIALFLQVRPLLGAGTMWKVFTGRYHKPRREQRIYMFLDIKNSTALAARLGDAQTLALITQVFFDMDRWVVGLGGEVLSYNGDEMVTTWLVSDSAKDARCLESYRQIDRMLAEKAPEYQAQFGVSPEIWAGIHLGPVVVGECGDSKRAIVHIGDTPNTAARLQHHAKEIKRDCLISGSLLNAIKLPQDLLTEALGSVTLRGQDHTTEVFALTVTG